MDSCLDRFDFSTSSKHSVYMVLSAILNLGNIQFDESSDFNGCFIMSHSRIFLCNVAALLNANEADLEDALTCHTRNIGNQQIK